MEDNGFRGFREKVRREAEILSQLNNPHIIRNGDSLSYQPSVICQPNI
jgi:hypothetical protein